VYSAPSRRTTPAVTAGVAVSRARIVLIGTAPPHRSALDRRR
jgi:hypothetical protein